MKWHIGKLGDYWGIWFGEDFYSGSLSFDLARLSVWRELKDTTDLEGGKSAFHAVEPQGEHSA